MSDNLTWRPLLSNLVEASAEVGDLAERLHYLTFGEVPEWASHDKATLEYIERKRPLTEGSLFVKLEHVLHHLNWAWNCRHESEDSVWKFLDADAERWGKLPRDAQFADLWPKGPLAPEPQSEYEAKPLDIAGIRMFILTADVKLQSLAYRVARQINDGGEGWSPRFRGFTPKNVDAPITEEAYAQKLHVIYSNINGAWNNRFGRFNEITPETGDEYRKFSPDFAYGSYNMWI